jgi:hypothetical protein
VHLASSRRERAEAKRQNKTNSISCRIQFLMAINISVPFMGFEDDLIPAGLSCQQLFLVMSWSHDPCILVVAGIFGSISY